MRAALNFLMAFTFAAGSCPGASAFEPAAPLSSLEKMPVKEITVFKDGHAFVVHEGRMPTDGAGDVLMDYLPTPVLGTFWTYSNDKNATLSSVVASRRRVLVHRTAMNIPDLLMANPGASAKLSQVVPGAVSAATVVHDGSLLGIPVRTSKEIEDTVVDAKEPLPERSNIVMLKTPQGTVVMPVDKVHDVTFRGDFATSLDQEEFRSLLKLNLDWKGKPAPQADVGMIYVQKGMRWIPSYKININKAGQATIKLQATLINDLTDLNDVTANLVIGVPQFAFKGEIDPIGLQQAAASVTGALAGVGGSFGNMRLSSLSNAIMTQSADYRAQSYSDEARAESPEIAGQQKNEDLFVFTAKHITLKKGQRMVVPIGEYTASYKDVYTLDVPFTPPPELVQQHGNPQQTAIARELLKPKVIHKLRISNKTGVPFTTAPALIVADNAPLAQGLMKYTAPGGEVDVDVTTAVDITVKKNEKETGRTPNAVKWQGYEYARVDLDGTIQLKNFSDKPVSVEVSRRVFGKVNSADNNGKIEAMNVVEDFDDLFPAGYPYWWSSYSWPGWWHHMNGVGKVDWKVTLEPGKTIPLGYTWSYYWRH